MNYMLILVPALDAALQKHKRVRVLYQLTPDFEGFTTGSMWDDAKLGLAHLKA
ncbi:STAS/SEC14 domain-containing protein [Acidithiobacillus ferriphilus]|uniref:STAS/SEC14 domain-containing protein n=1 Tax=Acidithiobacillus ferriphilus TaxID=1689834 RepID=UPI003FD6DD3C